jgi:phosphate transport system substrate-binding protein
MTNQGEKSMRKLSATIAAAALTASVLFAGPAANAETISSGGASYQSAIQKVCTASYTAHSVTYTSSSSGTGKTNFATGATQFAGTDSLYAPGTEPANFTYVPVLGGPVGIVFNVAGVTNLNLTPKLISDIFTAKITKWNHAAIKAVNKTTASKLPDTQIQIVYRASTSGTTNNFANYLSQTVGGKWTANDTWSLASGSTTGTAASGSAGVVSTVKSLNGAIGYVDLADAATAGLPFAAVQNGAKQFVKPSVNASKLFLGKQLMNANGVVLFDYNEAVKGGYNLSLISYAVAPTKAGTAKATAVKEYLTYFLNTCSPKEAAGLNFVALSGNALKTANKLVARVK